MFKRMDVTRPRSVVGWAVLTGIGAGLVAAVYFSIAGEPAIEDAIEIEEATAAAEAAESETAGDDAGHPAEDEHADDSVEVSRTTQRGVGLFSAYAVFGAAFGLLLAVAALTLRGEWLDPFRRIAVAGSILAAAITVVPWFKYPPNPPAVGDPSTAGERQRFYLLLIGLAGLILAGAAHLSARLRRAGWDQARRVAFVGASALVALTIVLVALPANDDPIPSAVPTSLIWRFRVASLFGNVLLWSLLTVGFGLLYAESARRRAVAESASEAAEGSAQNSMPFIAETPSS